MAGTLIVVALVLLVTYSIWKRRKEGRLSPASYRIFFITGLAWLFMGSAIMALSLYLGMPLLYAMPLLALGAVYLIIGLLNRNKWGQ